MRRYPREKLSEIRFADVESFVWDLSVATGTRAARDRNLRTFFGWAVREGLLTSSSLEDLDRPPQPEKIPRNLRHGFCTTLAEAGKSGPVIQAAARH